MSDSVEELRAAVSRFVAREARHELEPYVDALVGEIEVKDVMIRVANEHANFHEQRAEKLSGRVDELEAALRFYADRNNYVARYSGVSVTTMQGGMSTISRMAGDWGARARAALSGGERKEGR